MAIAGRLADAAQKSAVLFLAGTTAYYLFNVGALVNRRVELKKQGKLHEELARLNDLMEKQKTETSGTVNKN